MSALPFFKAIMFQQGRDRENRARLPEPRPYHQMSRPAFGSRPRGYPNNQIPVSSFDRPSLAMLKYLPASSSGNGLAFYSTPVIQNFDEFIVRVDYSLSNNDRLNFRYNKAWYDQPGIFANDNLLTYADHTPNSSYNTAVQHTHIFSPNLLNDFRFGVTREITSRHPPENVPNVRDFGVQSNVYQTPNKAIESFNVSGYFGFGAFADSVFARTTFDWYDTVIQHRYLCARPGGKAVIFTTAGLCYHPSDRSLDRGPPRLPTDADKDRNL